MKRDIKSFGSGFTVGALLLLVVCVALLLTTVTVMLNRPGKASATLSSHAFIWSRTVA